MKKETVTVTRFTLQSGFFAEVIPTGGEVSFWLGHRECDIKELMFAASAPFAPAERWEAMLTEDLEDYMADFREAWLED